MRKIEIDLTEEQVQKLTTEIKERAVLNLHEKTFSGFDLVLGVVDGDVTYLELKMGNVIKLGEVDWRIK
jgi:uncharacterized protein (UPF0128 family)